MGGNNTISKNIKKNQNLRYSRQLQDAGEEKNCIVFGHRAYMRGQFTEQA